MPNSVAGAGKHESPLIPLALSFQLLEYVLEVTPGGMAALGAAL